MPKDPTIVIKFKDPDFQGELVFAGVKSKAAKKLCELAEFGEYWALEITMNPDGSIEHAEFIDVIDNN